MRFRGLVLVLGDKAVNREEGFSWVGRSRGEVSELECREKRCVAWLCEWVSVVHLRGMEWSLD